MGAKHSKTSIGDTGTSLRSSVGRELIEDIIERRTSLKLDDLSEIGWGASSDSKTSLPRRRSTMVGPKRRRTARELRQIRDQPTRLCRKSSVAPDEAFIVEEVLLEDLCALAGEEANKGGNLILSREKEELMKRLARNPETRNVFRSTKNVRKFSTNSIRGVDPSTSNSSPSNCNIQVSSNNSRVSLNMSNRGSNCGSNAGTKRLSTPLNNAPELPENKIIEDTVRLRRRSMKKAQNYCPNGAHDLMTQSNYRSEIKALRIAQQRESCTTARNCLMLCNIYI